MTSVEESSGFYDRFEVPLRDPQATPTYPSDQVIRRSLRHRFRRRRRRLAVLDTHLPWPLSGFRFHEFTEIQRQRPDAMFFSLNEMAVPFGSPVNPLDQFPDLSRDYGVTDVYMVFLNFTVSVLGLAETEAGNTCPGVDPRLSLRRSLDSLGIRVHTTLYPGGGLVPGETSAATFEAVADRASTVFTNLPLVLAAMPSAVYSHAVTATDFYRPVQRRWSAGDKVTLVFAADDRPRKGLATVIDAFNTLDPSRFHLHIVGPHHRHLKRLSNPSFTAHGWLSPEALRGVYQASDVFVSPVSVDDPNDPDAEPGMIDGFPTSCALDAMATGCHLITSNPWGESPRLRPGVDFTEIPVGDAPALARAIHAIADHPAQARAIAESGRLAVVEKFGVAAGVSQKLERMGV